MGLATDSAETSFVKEIQPALRALIQPCVHIFFPVWHLFVGCFFFLYGVVLPTSCCLSELSRDHILADVMCFICRNCQICACKLHHQIICTCHAGSAAHCSLGVARCNLLLLEAAADGALEQATVHLRIPNPVTSTV